LEGVRELKGNDEMTESSTQGLLPKAMVLETAVDVISMTEAVSRIIDSAVAKVPYSCACVGMHTFINAHRDPQMRALMDNIDLKLVDSTPAYWYLLIHGYRTLQKIRGQDLLANVCADAEERGLSVYFFGTKDTTLSALKERLAIRFPNLRVAGCKPGRYRTLSESEVEADVDDILSSGADIIWVGLGSPRQDIWVYEMAQRLNRPLIGIGAAFDFEAGIVKVAPKPLQELGLEWLHRLCTNPRRLWKRYLFEAPYFLWLLLSRKSTPYVQGKRLAPPSKTFNLG
jgi:exopolysaccharide biosynthesis WecB/TagA/CpsF family protein